MGSAIERGVVVNDALDPGTCPGELARRTCPATFGLLRGNSTWIGVNPRFEPIVK